MIMVCLRLAPHRGGWGRGCELCQSAQMLYLLTQQLCFPLPDFCPEKTRAQPRCPRLLIPPQHLLLLGLRMGEQTGPSRGAEGLPQCIRGVRSRIMLVPLHGFPWQNLGNVALDHSAIPGVQGQPVPSSGRSIRALQGPRWRCLLRVLSPSLWLEWSCGLGSWHGHAPSGSAPRRQHNLHFNGDI